MALVFIVSRFVLGPQEIDAFEQFRHRVQVAVAQASLRPCQQDQPARLACVPRASRIRLRIPSRGDPPRRRSSAAEFVPAHASDNRINAATKLRRGKGPSSMPPGQFTATANHVDASSYSPRTRCWIATASERVASSSHTSSGRRYAAVRAGVAARASVGPIHASVTMRGKEIPFVGRGRVASPRRRAGPRLRTNEQHGHAERALRMGVRVAASREKIGDEAVMPVPTVGTADRHEEELLPGDQLEVIPRVPAVDDGLGEIAAEYVDDGGAKDEVAEIVGLLREHLVEEIVDDGSVTESRARSRAAPACARSRCEEQRASATPPSPLSTRSMSGRRPPAPKRRTGRTAPSSPTP